MTARTTVKLNVAFKPLYTSPKRYFLITGGRGGLKTSSVHDWVARLTEEVGHGILFTRYTMVSAEMSIIPEFTQTLDRLGMRHRFHITRTKVINKRTGSFILFSGIKTSQGDQTGRLKSIAGITTWIIEEGEDFNDEKAFDTIDESIRSTTHQNRVIWIQNPTTKEHFIYKKFIEPKNKKEVHLGYDVTVSDLPEVCHIHTTYTYAEHLGYLSPSWLHNVNQIKEEAEAAEAERPGSKYKSKYYFRYVGGWLEKAEGVIFEHWQEGEFIDTGRTCNGLDWGFVDPLAITQVSIDSKNMIIYARLRGYRSEVEDVPQFLKVRGVNKKELIICDTNEPRTAKAVKAAGYNIKTAKKEYIKDDIREIKNYTLIIDPGSTKLKTELNNYAWDDKKSETPIDDYNHGIDALRYAFRRLIGSKKKGLRAS